MRWIAPSRLMYASIWVGLSLFPKGSVSYSTFSYIARLGMICPYAEGSSTGDCIELTWIVQIDILDLY